MKGVIDWIVDVARILWNIFCLAPITCILIVIAFVVTVYLTYHFIKDVVMPDNGGILILR